MHRRWLILPLLSLLLALASCNSEPVHPMTTGSNAVGASSTPVGVGAREAGDSEDAGNTIIADHNISTLSFQASGGLSGSYTIQSSPTLSKLRHGRKEFTIDLVGSKQSIILAFYGYNGPGIYTLTNGTNGGDVRISQDQESWDLALQTQDSCMLTISTETPTQDASLEKMSGAVSCPRLTSQTRPNVTLLAGQFAIFMIVES